MNDATSAMPAWLSTMKSLIGTAAAADNVEIVGWDDVIGKVFPDLDPYAHTYTNDRIAWCGHSMAYVMSVNGIRPPQGYLLAANWATWGTDASDNPQLGYTVVFKWRGGSDAGGHHVTMISGFLGDHFLCCGGNQHHMVNETLFPKSEAIAIRRPPSPSIIPTAATSSVVTQQQDMRLDRFNACLPYTLAQECPYPNDWSNPKNFSDDPNPTMCGIEQAEYDVYRKTKGLLVQDIRKITSEEGANIYLHSYWLPHSQLIGLGLDLEFFDASVNQGSFKSVKILQHALGVEEDGDWGDETGAALIAADLIDVITAFTARRKEVYRETKGFDLYGNDWEKRADQIGAEAIKMASVLYPPGTV